MYDKCAGLHFMFLSKHPLNLWISVKINGNTNLMHKMIINQNLILPSVK